MKTGPRYRNTSRSKGQNLGLGAECPSPELQTHLSFSCAPSLPALPVLQLSPAALRAFPTHETHTSHCMGKALHPRDCLLSLLSKNPSRCQCTRRVSGQESHFSRGVQLSVELIKTLMRQFQTCSKDNFLVFDVDTPQAPHLLQTWNEVLTPGSVQCQVPSFQMGQCCPSGSSAVSPKWLLSPHLTLLSHSILKHTDFSSATGIFSVYFTLYFN